MSTPILSAEKLSVGYDSISVVTDLDLVVQPGEVVCLLGANGAGKSTTLLALAGELVPQSGTSAFNGNSRREALFRRARRGLSFVPEERSVITALSVRDNLRLGRGPVTSATELFPELEPLLDRRAGLLSGGEQQILALARALACEPSLIMADELSLGLAPKIVTRLLEALREAADERGVGVLLVEQHVRTALKYADRAYVLARGKIVMHGAAADLARNIEEVESHYLSEVASDGSRSLGR